MLIIILIAFFSSCSLTSLVDTNNKNTSLNIDSLVVRADSLFKKQINLTVYVKVVSDSELIKIDDFNKWPEI